MDPVTGLSRRQLVALALLVPVGIAASTVATVISEDRQACPDERNGCSTSMAGEPIVIGVMLASAAGDDPAYSNDRESAGRRIQIDVVHPGCSVRAAAEEARDLSDDPPDYAPTSVVISDLCDEAASIAAQVLDDEGVPMVSLGAPAPPTTALEQDLATGEPVPSIDELLDLIVGAVDAVAIREGDRAVIPLTELREALVAQGFLQA